MAYESHPYADLFPQMLPEEWGTFLSGIHENGVLIPIVLYQGKILDGRHRWQAVSTLAEQGIKIECPITYFEGDDAAAIRYAYEMNIRRRHLTTGQRACIGVPIKQHLQESVKQGQRTDLTSGKNTGSDSRDMAGQIVNVSGKTIDKAEKLQENAPDLFERVQAGEMPLSAAENALAIRNGTQTPAQAIKAVVSEIVTSAGVENITEAQLESVARVLTTGTTAHVGQNTGVPEWYTPPNIIQSARSVLRLIELDPASSAKAQETVQAKKFYTIEEDGLAQDWRGIVWLNPPYTAGTVDKFVEKLCQHFESGEVESAILLVNNATETTWFQRAACVARVICFPEKRIRFLDAEGKPGAPLQGQAILYFGVDVYQFIYEFRQYGFCCEVRR